MDMRVNIAGVEWKNPVTVASRDVRIGCGFADYVDLNRLGGDHERRGGDIPWADNPTPRVAETYGRMMNAVGLQNPGIDVFASGTSFPQTVRHEDHCQRVGGSPRKTTAKL